MKKLVSNQKFFSSLKQLFLGVVSLFLVAFTTSVWGKSFSQNTHGFAEMQGRRPTMEDAHHIECTDDYIFFGLYDGHGGRKVADFAAQWLHNNINKPEGGADLDFPALLREAFLKTHDDLDQLIAYNQGCTALVTCVHGDCLFVANAGDSRAVLCSAGVAVPLSIDHKPDRATERERIEELGGSVITWGVPRVNGRLAVARALGDKALNPFVTPDPEIIQHTLTDADEFLIMACDGVWDVMDNQVAVDIVKKSLETENDFQNAAEALRNAAYDRGSTDNISVMIINLKQ